MIDPAVFIGEPLVYGKIKIYPPKVKDLATNLNFSAYKKLLTLSQEEIEDIFIEKKEDPSQAPTPFRYLLQISQTDESLLKIIREAFSFFLKTEVQILSKVPLVIVGDLEKELTKIKSLDQLVTISEENYFVFQNLIREVCGEKKVEPPNPNEDPRIKRIKAKARYRDKIKAKKGMGISLSTSLTSICCMGIGITPLNIGEMSYAAVSALMERYQEHEKYQLDINSLLAGADSKKVKPKYWIRNLE